MVGHDTELLGQPTARNGMTDAATISLFVRSLPPRYGFLVPNGLVDSVTFLEDVGFTGDVRAIPDGRIVLAGEPILEVTAPIAEAQLVGAALLWIVARQTATASKAANRRLAEISGRADERPRLACELVVYAGQPVIALNSGHANLPGAKQVFRDELTGEDILALHGEPTPPRHIPLLSPVIAAGKHVNSDDEHGPADDAAAARRRFEADLARLPEQIRQLDHPAPLVPTASVALRRLHDELLERLLYRQQLDARVTEARMLIRT